MDTLAVVLEAPERLALEPARPRLRRRRTTSSSMSTGAASAPAPSGCSGPAACRPSPAWAIRWSPATNRSAASSQAGSAPAGASASTVFVPGARCFGEVRGLFGGAASRLVVPAPRVVPLDGRLGEQGVLLALAATAYHAIAGARRCSAELHRRPRRAGPAAGAARRRCRRRPPVVWETQPRARAAAPSATRWSIPTDDARRDYRAHLRRQRRRRRCSTADRPPRAGRRDRAGRLLRASRCPSPSRRPSCARRASASPPNGSQPDLAAVTALIDAGALSLDGLITHRRRRRGCRRTPTAPPSTIPPA